MLALRERKQQAPLSFKQAIAAAVVVGLISLPVTAGFLWWYDHYLNPPWLDYIVEHRRLTMGATGATPDAIARMEADQRASGTDRAQITAALIGTTGLTEVLLPV